MFHQLFLLASPMFHIFTLKYCKFEITSSRSVFRVNQFIIRLTFNKIRIHLSNLNFVNDIINTLVFSLYLFHFVMEFIFCKFFTYFEFTYFFSLIFFYFLLRFSYLLQCYFKISIDQLAYILLLVSDSTLQKLSPV